MRRLALILILFLNCPLLAQEKHEQAKLTVSLRSLKTTYRLSERIQLEIQLTNVGQDAFLINRRFSWGVGRTDIRTFDSNGKEVIGSFLADVVPQMPKQGDFLELRRDEFFGVRLDEPITHFVESPGTYDLAVEYTNTDSEEWTRRHFKLLSMPLWSRERGTIASTRIRIEVEK